MRKFLQRLLTGSAVANLSTALAVRNELHKKFSALHAAHEASAADVEALRQKWFSSHDAADLQAWAAAVAQRETMTKCLNESSNAHTHLVRAKMDELGAREMFIAAFREVGATLSARIEEMADSERARLSEAGLETTAEHPVLSKLRDRSKRLSELAQEFEANPALWHERTGDALAALEIA